MQSGSQYGIYFFFGDYSEARCAIKRVDSFPQSLLGGLVTDHERQCEQMCLSDMSQRADGKLDGKWVTILWETLSLLYCAHTVFPPLPMTRPAAAAGTLMCVSSLTSSLGVKKFSSLSFRKIRPWAWKGERDKWRETLDSTSSNNWGFDSHQVLEKEMKGLQVYGTFCIGGSKNTVWMWSWP